MEKSIKFINDTIKFVSKKLNDINIKFYVVGAIGGYIDAGIPIQRNHDDLDLMIEEKDIDKVKKIFADSAFVFYDNRLNNNKFLNEYGYTEGDHEVFAQHINSEFHIGFFLFDINEKEYTIIEYYTENGKNKRLERTLPIDVFKYQYNEEASFEGRKIKVARKELIYKNKLVMNREKDLFDIRNLEDEIDKEILEHLKGLSKLRKTKTTCC